MSPGPDLGAESAQPIIERFLAGDTREYYVIRERIERYVARLYNGDALEREDLVADIIHILLRRLSQNKFTGRTLADLRNYIFGIARYRVIQTIERRKRRAVLFERLQAEIESNNSSSLPESVDSQQLLDRICSEMDSDGGRLLRLKFELGWTNREIAEHLNKTPNAVSTALSRCLAKVRELGLVRDLLYPGNRRSE